MNSEQIIRLYYEAAGLAHRLVMRSYDRRRRDSYRNRCCHLSRVAMRRLERRTDKYNTYKAWLLNESARN